MAVITSLDESHISASLGAGRKYGGALATFLRPANATPYAAGDVISDSASVAAAIEFTNCGARKGGSGAILRAHVSVDVNHASVPNLELYIFDHEPTNHLDNAALALADSDIVKLHTSLIFTGSTAKVLNASASPAGAIQIAAALELPRPFVCDPDSRSLYGLLVTRSVFTPVSGAKWYVHLEIEQD